MSNDEFQKDDQVTVRELEEKDHQFVVTLALVGIFGVGVVIALIQNNMTMFDKMVALGGWLIGPAIGFYFRGKKDESN